MKNIELDQAISAQQMASVQRGQVLLLLRWVLIISIAYLLLFSRPLAETPTAVAIFVALYLASNVVLSQVLGRIAYQTTLEWVVVVADTLAVTLALTLLDGASGELFVLYFVVLFLSALSDRIGLVAGAVLFISVAHLYTASRFLDGAELITQGYILRVPFLFAVGLFFGNLVHNARVQQRQTEAEQARAVRSEFLSTVSHDLRNPLGVIDSLAGLLTDGEAGPLNAGQANLIQRIQVSARQVLNLSGNLIDAERIEAGRLVMRTAPADLGRIVEDAVLMARSASDLKEVSLSTSISDDLPCAEVDVVQIERVLSNLLGNAIKFTTRGGHITVSLSASHSGFCLSVADNGIGIAPAVIPSLGTKHFSDPFSHRSDGSGLGLFIVNTVVKAHGGRFEITSRPRCGTTVTVFLPLPGRSPTRPRLEVVGRAGLDVPAIAESA
jgi:signal transduction histidine kinase